MANARSLIIEIPLARRKFDLNNAANPIREIRSSGMDPWLGVLPVDIPEVLGAAVFNEL